ncbi:MAG: amidohydrolase [Belnapia sp.]|nr:amidohydrolase [Belnapia sp.]
MEIVDAQVHLWRSGTPSGHHRQVPAFTAEELLAEMDAAGVDAALIHPPISWDPDSNDQAVAAAQRYPRRFAVLGQVPLDQPEASAARLPGWRALPGMMGLRYPLVRPEQHHWHSDGTMDWLWPVAEREGLPVATMAGRFLPVFRGIAERHPRLRLLIDHLGLVREAQDAAAFANLDELLALAKLPNVAIKATGAPGYSTEAYPYRNLHDGLRRIFEAFGPRRFFWGTDITRMPCSYRQCVTMFTEELPWLRGEDLEWVMGRGIRDWIGWRPVAE